MGQQITIRGVREEVRNELAARAGRRHQSLQQFLHAELERIAAKPSIEEWLERVRQHVEASGSTVSASSILEAKDADRK